MNIFWTSLYKKYVWLRANDFIYRAYLETNPCHWFCFFFVQTNYFRSNVRSWFNSKYWTFSLNRKGEKFLHNEIGFEKYYINALINRLFYLHNTFKLMFFSIMCLNCHFTSQWSDTIFRFICNSFTWEIVLVWPLDILYFQIVSQDGLQWTMQFKGPIVSCSLILIRGLLCTFGGSNLILSGPSEIYVQVFIIHSNLLIFFQNKCCKI